MREFREMTSKGTLRVPLGNWDGQALKVRSHTCPAWLEPASISRAAETKRKPMVTPLRLKSMADISEIGDEPATQGRDFGGNGQLDRGYGCSHDIGSRARHLSVFRNR